MTIEIPQARFCQSCGMPLGKTDDFGTGADGGRVPDYCHFCYEGGQFTDPRISEHAMIEKCASIMAGQGVMPEGPARGPHG